MDLLVVEGKPAEVELWALHECSGLRQCTRTLTKLGGLLGHVLDLVKQASSRQ